MSTQLSYCSCITLDFFCLSDNLALWIRGNSWHLFSVICAVFCYIRSLMFVDIVRFTRQFTLFVIIALQILIRKTILQLIWTKKGRTCAYRMIQLLMMLPWRLWHRQRPPCCPFRSRLSRQCQYHLRWRLQRSLKKFHLISSCGISILL